MTLQVCFNYLLMSLIQGSGLAVLRELHLTSICYQIGVLLEKINQLLSMNSDQANFQVGVLLGEIYS